MLIEHSPHNSRIHWQQMLSMLSLELTDSSCTLSGRRLPNAQSEKPQFVGCSFKKTAFVKNWRVQLITHMTSPVQPSCFDWGDIFHPSHCVPQSIKMRNIQESVFGVPTVAEWDLAAFGSPRMQVWFLAWRSRLRVQHCILGCNCTSDLIPGTRTTYAAGKPKNI